MANELHIRPLPYLDTKWLRADLISSLRNIEDEAVLWNNLIQDFELVSSSASPSLNSAGNLSYLGDDGKHYCGAEKLTCLCCPGYCSPFSGCNCASCHLLDSEGAIKKQTNNQAKSTQLSSDVILEKWLWSSIPSSEQKNTCLNALHIELHDLALQAAGNCISATHLYRQLFIYKRYFIALSRCRKQQKQRFESVPALTTTITNTKHFSSETASSTVDKIFLNKNKIINTNSLKDGTLSNTTDNDNEKAALSLARVGTRAALNFSFAFLRRAWRSGEDIDLCSELLTEALESLQSLPEASLFDTSQVSPLWIEVLERSIKFLRQVVLGDAMNGRYVVPREDRHIALSLLLELGAQKGSLGASLEGVVLLLLLCDKEKDTDDNRDAPQNTGAPLLPILKRYERISNYGIPLTPDVLPSSATESFLRFLTLPDQENCNVDFKKAAVIIISHLDRLAKPHMPRASLWIKPPSTFSKPSIQKRSTNEHDQQVFALGWPSLYTESYGFTVEPAISIPLPGANTNYPQYSAPNLDIDFEVKQVAFSEDTILILSQTGKVYSLKINKPDSEMQTIRELPDMHIVKIAAHWAGKHYLVLDSTSQVYSWGFGGGGRLGHGDTNTKDDPTIIAFLSDKEIINIACGGTYSAAISNSGDLYTWGRGTYGRLGHGTSDDKLVPCLVQALKGHKVIDVALGSGDSHTLCVTEEGFVFAWGDGDYGKLGNGSCNGSQVPIKIETLPRVRRVFTGSQFSLALTYEGKIYTWGKGLGGRLGHGYMGKNMQTVSETVSTPKLVQSLDTKVITDVSVGAAHCLAISNVGEVFGWGRNDYQQICPPSISRDPIILCPILATHPSIRVSGISCGSAQSIIWCQTSHTGISTRIPFVTDLSEHTFRLLDQLLGIVCGQEGRQTPSQESECIAVACLNLLRLQLHALIANNLQPKSVGLGEGNWLLISLKTKVLNLAGGSNVLKTMQEAAQWALQVGWSILLPTASERAQTLTSLLPSEPGVSSSGHRFMTDLLVGSLMAEGGLETALNQAITSEPESCINNAHNLPLMHLIKQLLRNNSTLTQACLTQLLVNDSFLKTPDNNEIISGPEQTSPSLDLLHRFQRLLLSHIHQAKNEDISGAEALLEEYIQNIVNVCISSLLKAYEVAFQGKDGVIDVLKSDISDTLLCELLIGLILLNCDKPEILSSFKYNKTFLPLLTALDNLNRLICDCEAQDSDDMGWPGIISRATQKTSSVPEESLLIRKSDIENHVTDGGKWIILNGYVYDIQEYQCENPIVNEILQNGIGKDLTLELSNTNYRHILEYITAHFKVGKYGCYDLEDKFQYNNNQRKLLTHFTSERALAYLLGQRSCILQSAIPLQPAEIQCKSLLKSKILSGGLQVLQPANPFDEEKGEARSSASTAGSTPTEPTIHQHHIQTDDCNELKINSHWSPHSLIQQRVESLICGLSEAKLTDPTVSAWITISEKFCKENNIIWHQEFSVEHPIQDLERLLSAALIRHQGLGPLVLAVIDRELGGKSEKPPKQIAEIIRLVYQTKWNVIRIRQQLNRSYKEVCAPLLERLRFLVYEVRPVISLEQSGLKRLSILHKVPRFKNLVKKIISEMRIAKKQLACAKPEDILNVTIQSQHSAQKNQSQENLCRTSNSTENFLIDPQVVMTIQNQENPELSNCAQKHTTSGLTIETTADIDNDTGDNINKSQKSVNNNTMVIKSPTTKVDDIFSQKQKEHEQFVDDVILQLSKKYFKTCSECGELSINIMNQIVEFVIQEVCDVDTLRRAMYCQVQRYKIRKQGIDMFHELLQINGLLDAVQYNILSGYLGVFFKNYKRCTQNILQDLNMITAYQKASLILEYSKILEWSIVELQRLVNQEQITAKQKAHGTKDNSNLGTYVFLKKLPRARFLLSLFGILNKDFGPNELSLIVNSGVIGTILGLLRQTGDSSVSAKCNNTLSVVYEDTLLKQKCTKANLTGPELAKLMKVGTRVCRGVDWKWGDQDGTPPGEGRIISEVGEDGWVRVEWDTGATNSYRMGKEGQYDLRLADSALNIVSPDTDTEKEYVITETNLSGESHPTKLLRHACIKMLRALLIGISKHNEKMEKTSLINVTAMFRSAVNIKSNISNSFCGFDTWTTLGFLRSIVGNSKILSKYISTPIWINLYFQLLDLPIICEQDVFKKLHCLRLLQTVLVHWNEDDVSRCNDFIQRMFSVLGKICLYCSNDISLIQNSNDTKSRSLLSTSHSGTIAEEIIILFRKLHSLTLWNPLINSFISQKLCIAADLFSDINLNTENYEKERIFVIATLNVIGGCDPRPRPGLQLTYEGEKAIITSFTQKGKCILNIESDCYNAEPKQISIKIAANCADNNIFSLSRLPMNEMLLNSWAVLIYGAGERKESIPAAIDVKLLRLQQIQLSALSANCVLYDYQIALRRILKQRSPGLTQSSSEESLSDQQEQPQNYNSAGFSQSLEENAKSTTNGAINYNIYTNNPQREDSPISESELLIQTILIRATQPSPIKAIYTFEELRFAALNVSQMLSSHIEAEINAPMSYGSKSIPPAVQPTLIHGVPIYNDGINDESSTTISNNTIKYLQDEQCSSKTKNSTSSLTSQIMEMGFSQKSVDLAIKNLKSSVTPEQVVQWILEHPDLCPPIPSSSGTQNGFSHQTNESDVSLANEISTKLRNDSDLDSDSSSSSSDTIGAVGLLAQDQLYNSGGDGIRKKFATRNDFKTDDQYAMYVRGFVCPGMTVRCCRSFEEIKEGDIGTVLKVDTEGLHDLNVQVDWQIHGSTYWVCFVHIEILEASRDKSQTDQNSIVVGSQVRIKSQISTPRYKWGLVTRGSIGIVTSINDNDVTVDFPQQSNWTGCLSEMELVNPTRNDNGISSNYNSHYGDLIEDWSRCIRSLTVSSNESLAKHLLDKSNNYWQSSSSMQGKHWIRLEMHENILIHSLSVIVSPSDCSHMPSLIVTRVGDSTATLKEFNWVSVKPTDTHVPILNDVHQYYQWIEIMIKQCRNNGIQCRVHGINIVGRRKQTDLDLMLMNASFLAYENDNLCEPTSSTSYTYSDDKSSQSESPCTVFIWGLNDKEQLGGLKGSKVKIPTFSNTLSQLRPIHIAGGSKSLFIVTQDGKVYACGEGTNGRLGLGHNCNVSKPRQIPVISQYVVKKVAVHSGGKHALALTLDGKVFSWGEGEDGKLGHGNRLTLDKPKLIETLRSKRVRDIACGSSHSAAITSSGELYTWGLGEYGRLGHGDNCTQLKPKLVTALLGKRVIQVACGSRDAQTLALTEDRIVYSWGDGDFGKLGRGGSEGSSLPHEIDRLTGIGVIQIECGAQFSLALTRNGEVWTWGKGDYYRLGHGTDQHVRKPAPIQGLRGKKVIHVAVGALHCLAVTDTGQVYAWGDNDHGQQGSGNTIVNKKPQQVIGLDSVFVNRVACGSSHSIAWGLPQSPTEEDKKGPVPFSVTKDPLGGSSLGIYDSESQVPLNVKQAVKSSLSETLLSLETYGARQTALNYVLNAMSILQSRQLIISALTSHSYINTNKKIGTEFACETVHREPDYNETVNQANLKNSEEIAQGGGEAPADVADMITPDSAVLPETDIVPLAAGPLSAFQSLTGSVSLSASVSSCNGAQRHSKMSASAMSVMAATMTHQEEIIAESSVTGLDDFTSLLGESEAKSLVELLKLSVAGRTGPPSTSKTIADTLIALGSNSPSIGAMLLETCITELEDLCTSRHCLGKIPKPVVQETSHPYVDDVTLVGHVKIPGAEALRLEFDSQCSTEKRNDPLVIMDGSGRVIATRSGREYAQWAPEIRIPGDEMRWKFTSDSSVNGWGWRFWVHAIMPASFLQEIGSDRAVLSQPSMPLVIALLDSRLNTSNTNVLLRLASALAACSQLSSLRTSQRIWSLKKLHEILKNKHAPKALDPSLNTILMPLIPELLRQYEYEEPQVRGGIHLMHSEYFKTLAALACDMQLDSILPPGDMHKWSWFRRYCSAVRVAQSLIHRVELPRSFCMEVRKKLSEMLPSSSNPNQATTATVMTTSTTSLSSSATSNQTPSPLLQQSQQNSLVNPTTSSLTQYVDSVMSLSLTESDHKLNEQCQFLHEDHHLFKSEHDSQLLQWLNRKPEDWALSWGGASTIYGWGHNHRGQLGGLEGSRIKTPTPCEALSLLRPIQLAGGEQTLYAVTPDGKLFATGYGAGGRLGIGGTESVSTPTLVESLQHVFIKKVAVNSGGKHCLALTNDGEVYSWGEGEDGKLGHGNRMSYDRPKLIEALSGIGVADIACGSAHSACITTTGHVLTWGKGRYGRLGHGDSEDQLRPKLIEALLGYRAIDIACGSGDAQTLCITDDDNVWSWGDGDYGKLGRGGSDGCKVPMKIESLSGLGVIKVECGSQFSVALTRSGAVYTWGKGDYHRLGHGTVDHVRRPKKVAALQGKKIISIATGSLHCVACSDTGEVFTWGDNDEGQLGDGTISAIQRPRLVTALQGKHIVKVTCGSAHTLALSTSQLTEGARPPPSPPLEYDLVRDFSPEVLHARLVLLHHFSELLCPCLAMLPISGELSLGSLKDVLVYSIKEAAFRKVIQTTMVRDKQHGPVIELNRIQVKRSRSKSGSGLAGTDGMKSVFGQMVQKLPLLTQEALSLPHRVWKVKFVGESVDDCGGGYSESIAEMCDELQNGSVPLLIPTPNGRGEAGANRDCFLLDPTLTSVLQMNMFRFLGVLMGIAIRTGSPLSLNLAEAVWHQLAGEDLRPGDLTEVDRDYVAGLLCIRDMEDDQKVFSTLELPFTTSSAKGHEVQLSTRYTRITPQNRNEYVRLALNYRLHEFDEQVKAVRDGMSKVIPVPFLSLFSAAELQAMVCGSPDIPLSLLKSVANYKGVDVNSPLVQWFWEVMEEFTNQERSLFLRFVWGRTRLPRTIADFRGRDFVLQVLDKYNPPDHFLPESYTCFFLLKMPRYSCKAVLMEKLKYAIHFCKSIDTDEYARVAMGDPTEATGSEDNSDLESVASHDEND